MVLYGLLFYVGLIFSLNISLSFHLCCWASNSRIHLYYQMDCYLAHLKGLNVRSYNQKKIGECLVCSRNNERPISKIK